MTRQEYYILVDAKRTAEKNFNRMYELFYEELQWTLTKEGCEAMEDELTRLFKKQEEARLALTSAWKEFSQEELREMSIEYKQLKKAAAI